MGSGLVDADVLDVNNAVATLPQAPQDEAGPNSIEGQMEIFVDEMGLASEEAVAHRSGPQQEVRVEANAWQPAPRTDLTREFSSEQRSINLQTIPVVEDANQHANEEKLDYPAAPPTLDLHTENYSRSPYPFDVGKVLHANVCPVCEKYTVTELNRSAGTVPSGTEETLRARFKCGLCQNVFDLGIALFDPRGIPGVTLYEGEDRLRPPVPPRGKYLCPRCWKTTRTSFQCMASYLREDSKVQCEPACPAERLHFNNLGKPEEKIEAEEKIRAKD